MLLPRKEMDQALKEHFVPLLRERGFKGSYPHFRRERPKHIELVGIQFSQWGGQFYIEISLGHKEGTEVEGKQILAKEMKFYHGWPRIRLGEMPFDYERDGVQQAAIKTAVLPEAIDQWFHENGS